MLFLLFQLGQDRYALDARRVVEVVPFLDLKRLLQAPKGGAGIFNYRGQPVPAVDLSELTLDHPATPRMSTRIVLVRYPDDLGRSHLVGLIAEHATETLRTGPEDLIDSGMRFEAAPYLGPVFMDSRGPIQLLREQYLLSAPVRDLLFAPGGVPSA
jgi:chemotaxis-related protein WspB